MKKFIHVEDAAVLLNNIVGKDYLADRIIGGDLTGREIKGKYFLAESDFESLKKMLIERDFSDEKIIEKRIDFLDFDRYKIKGTIIDIGGGGESVVERKFGNMVFASDKSLRELEKTKNDSFKTASDGRFLAFKNESFDNCTAFFSFMYMPVKTRTEAMKEVNRVLKKRGMFYIFEPKVLCRKYKPITLLTVKLKIKVNSHLISAAYGSILAKNGQTISHFKKIAGISGFSFEKSENFKSYFAVVFRKI